MHTDGVGTLIRTWRSHRRLSQLDLASQAAISTRHLSCVETGRSRPSREMVLHLADELDVPIARRNELLVAAGFAPEFRDLGYDDAELSEVRAVVDTLLAAHEPNPALVVDGSWSLVAMNGAAGFFAELIDPELLMPPANVLRATLHPDGMSRFLVDPTSVAHDLLTRLRKQIESTADQELTALHDELSSYPHLDVAEPPEQRFDGPPISIVALDVGGKRLSFVSTITTFGAPREALASELAIETFHPTDDATRAFLTSRS